MVLSDDEGAVMSSEREEEEERRKQEMIDFTKISFESLKAVSKGFNEHIKDDELKALIRAFDKDRDGKISVNEFRKLVK